MGPFPALGLPVILCFTLLLDLASAFRCSYLMTRNTTDPESSRVGLASEEWSGRINSDELDTELFFHVTFTNANFY